MVANSKQKLKLLYLYKMLEEETDSEHGLSMTEIIKRLNEVGIGAERKGIYRDIKVLKEFGIEVATIPHMPVEYTLVRTGLTVSEVNLLADAVLESRNLSDRTVKKLLKQLQPLVSVRDRKQLKKSVAMEGRIKKQGDSVYVALDAVLEAIRLKRKVAFQVFRFDGSMKKVLENGGAALTVTPVQVELVNGIYVLAAFGDGGESPERYRIDRMKSATVLEEQAAKTKAIADFADRKTGAPSLGSEQGGLVEAMLSVKVDRMDSIADEFGCDIAARPLDDETAEVTVVVNPNPHFFGWVAGMDGDVSIAAPEETREAYAKWIKRIARKA